MHEDDWVSAHVFYHGDLDPVILGLVQPLVEELRAAKLCDEYFFLRYWDGGNHLRLRFRGKATVNDDVRTLVEKRCIQYLWHRPSPTAQPLASYLEAASQLAAWEGLMNYSDHLHPNNSVAFIPYEREYGRYGSPESMRAVERHFVESSHIALGLLRAHLTPSQRDTAALSLLLLTWYRAGMRLPRTPEQLFPADETYDLRQSAERQRETVRGIAERMRAIAKDQKSPAHGLFAAWSDSIARLQSVLGNTPKALRILDTCAHLVCNRLGVSVQGERYLRDLAIRSAAGVD